MVLEGGTLEIKLVKLCKYITPGTFKEIIKYKEEVICYFFKSFFEQYYIWPATYSTTTGRIFLVLVLAVCTLPLRTSFWSKV